MQSELESAAVAVDDFSFYEQDARPPDRTAERSTVADRICAVMVFTNLLILPLCFGGVHERTYLVFRALGFLGTALVLIFQSARLIQIFSFHSRQGRLLSALGLFFIFVCAHSIYFYFKSVPHPVLGAIPALFTPEVTLNSVLEVAYFCSLFMLTSLWLAAPDRRKADRRITVLTRGVLIAALIVSLTALAHWFYDNGKLFWTFSPASIHPSPRARWPFVNPNHLAIYLIVPIFLTLGLILSTLNDFKHLSHRLSRRGKLLLSSLVGERTSHLLARSLTFLSVTILCLSLAVIASLSRNANISMLTTLLLFFAWPRARNSSAGRSSNRRHYESVKPALQDRESRSQSRSKRRRSEDRGTARVNSFDITKAIPFLKFTGRASVVLIALFTLWFFLGERGTELFSSRVEYALLYTQDDMRWQLYRDSLPMLWSSPVFGIGFGNWLALYPQVMSQGLSGMDPGYLHSDTLQLLIELGFSGAAVLLIALLVGLSALRKPVAFSWDPQADKIPDQTHTTIVERALLFGFLAVLFCSCFEFPFRIPALTALWSMALALFVSYSMKLRSS